MPRSFTVTALHPYAWLWEPLQEEPSFVLRSMFGAKAVYLQGKLALCFTASEEPWHGVLVCTAKEHHDSLRADFPALVPHRILPKWLYLADAVAEFETVAQRLVERVRQRDPRIGVEPSRKKAQRRRQSKTSERRRGP